MFVVASFSVIAAQDRAEPGPAPQPQVGAHLRPCAWAPLHPVLSRSPLPPCLSRLAAAGLLGFRLAHVRCCILPGNLSPDVAEPLH